MSSDSEQLKKISRTLRMGDLPIATYIISSNGELIECNSLARMLLGLPEGGEPRARIQDFFENREDYNQMISERRASMTNAIPPRSRQLALTIEGQIRWFDVYSKPILVPVDGTVLGYVESIVNVTENQTMMDLFDNLPSGIYRTDRNDRIVRANRTLMDMLGCDSPNDILNERIENFYFDKKEARRFKEKLMRERYVIQETVELVRKDQKRFFASATSYMLQQSGQYAGRQGSLLDITAEEAHRRIMDAIPLGTYMVSAEHDDDIITDCNKPFALMFGYPTAERLKKARLSIKSLYLRKGDYRRLQRLITQNDGIGKPLTGFKLDVKIPKGAPGMRRTFTIEVNAGLLKDKNMRVLGRAGVIRDVTDLVDLYDLGEDVGNVLHYYSSALSIITSGIRRALTALDPVDCDESDETDAIQRRHERLLARSSNIASLLDPVMARRKKDENFSEGLSIPRWGELEIRIGFLRNLERWVPFMEHRAYNVSFAVGRILPALIDLQERIPCVKEVDEAIVECRDVLRLCSRAELSSLGRTIEKRDAELAKIRELVTFHEIPSEDFELGEISEVIQSAIKEVLSYAQEKEVSFVINGEKQSTAVAMQISRVEMAIYNIMHNAVKYSWTRQDGGMWVNISYSSDAQGCSVKVQNYGVPIHKTELDQGHVLRVGYRGRFSGEKKRPGTGLGLTSARKVARQHGGDVTVDSVVASTRKYAGREDDYERAFLTTVIFSISNRVI